MQNIYCSNDVYDKSLNDETIFTQFSQKFHSTTQLNCRPMLINEMYLNYVDPFVIGQSNSTKLLNKT